MSTDNKSASLDYEQKGYTVLTSAAPEHVRRGLLSAISNGLAAPGAAERFMSKPGVNLQSSYEFHSSQFPLLLGFHWGLTRIMNEISGKSLAPSYAFFRAYQRGDCCRVHSDRPSCDHSMSLALAYSDDIVWPIEVGVAHHEFEEACRIEIAHDFGAEECVGVNLSAGDALVYRGVNRRHGRTMPNPNRWSAHLFLHWVDVDGPYAEWAYDKRPPPTPRDFNFPVGQAQSS